MGLLAMCWLQTQNGLTRSYALAYKIIFFYLTKFCRNLFVHLRIHTYFVISNILICIRQGVLTCAGFWNFRLISSEHVNMICGDMKSFHFSPQLIDKFYQTWPSWIPFFVFGFCKHPSAETKNLLTVTHVRVI